MKGKDRVLSQYLEMVCQPTRFHWFLAQIEKTETEERGGFDNYE
jgi:hypothetical protein